MSKRKNHSPGFKAKVSLAALSGEKTITELGSDVSLDAEAALLREELSA